MHPQEKTLAARLLLSTGERELRSIAIVKDAISLGRRPFNDVPLDDLTVSGEHAVIELRGSDFMLRDNGSRNGTTVNGRAVTAHRLSHGDVIGIGIYRLRFLVDQAQTDAEPATGADRRTGVAAGAEVRLGPASLEYLNRPPPGEWVEIDRPIVSIRGSVNVAVVSRRKHGYFVTHLEGASFPAVNGNPIGLTSHLLADGDLIELSGTMIRFRLRAG